MSLAHEATAVDRDEIDDQVLQLFTVDAGPTSKMVEV